MDKTQASALAYQKLHSNESRQTLIIAISTISIIIAYAAVSLRYKSRRLKKVPLGPDDWCIGASLVSNPKSTDIVDLTWAIQDLRHIFCRCLPCLCSIWSGKTRNNYKESQSFGNCKFKYEIMLELWLKKMWVEHFDRGHFIQHQYRARKDFCAAFLLSNLRCSEQVLQICFPSHGRLYHRLHSDFHHLGGLSMRTDCRNMAQPMPQHSPVWYPCDCDRYSQYLDRRCHTEHPYSDCLPLANLKVPQVYGACHLSARWIVRQ